MTVKNRRKKQPLSSLLKHNVSLFGTTLIMGLRIPTYVIRKGLVPQMIALFRRMHGLFRTIVSNLGPQLLKTVHRTHVIIRERVTCLLKRPERLHFVPDSVRGKGTSPGKSIWTHIPVFLRWIKKQMSYFDPSRVRTEDPPKHLLHSIAITVFFLGVGICAVTVAATGKSNLSKQNPPGKEPIMAEEVAPLKRLTPVGLTPKDNAPKNSTPSSHRKGTVDRPKNAEKNKPSSPKERSKPDNFYHSMYVFTSDPAESVSAYPLAAPPGIVVNLNGIPEPEQSASEFVGKDTRIIGVRRRVTNQGLRYILRLNTPIKQIETNHDGNVVIINPIR